MTKGRLFFRRLNRGLALGIVLVLAVVLYTVITGQMFKSADKPEIEAMAREYLSDLAAFHELRRTGALRYRRTDITGKGRKLSSRTLPRCMRAGAADI